MHLLVSESGVADSSSRSQGAFLWKTGSLSAQGWGHGSGRGAFNLLGRASCSGRPWPDGVVWVILGGYNKVS